MSICSFRTRLMERERHHWLHSERQRQPTIRGRYSSDCGCPFDNCRRGRTAHIVSVRDCARSYSAPTEGPANEEVNESQCSTTNIGIGLHSYCCAGCCCP